jgi:hypothetical protein
MTLAALNQEAAGVFSNAAGPALGVKPTPGGRRALIRPLLV